MHPNQLQDVEFRFVGGREVRVIRRGWRHPQADGRYVPLLPEGEGWIDQGVAGRTMPSTAGLGPEQTEVVAYEATTEGTPISPAFPNTTVGRRELVRYCAAHCTTFGRHRAGVEAWAAILFGDAAVTREGDVVAHD